MPHFYTESLVFTLKLVVTAQSGPMNIHSNKILGSSAKRRLILPRGPQVKPPPPTQPPPPSPPRGLP